MMKPYDSYKETDYTWFGNIPVHWENIKINELFSERKTKVSDKEYAPLSVSKQGIVPQLATACKTDNGDNRKLVKVGDFVINSRSDRKGSSGISSLDGSVSLINLVLKPRKDLHKQFMHYLLKSNDFIEEYYRNGRGIVADLWTTRYSEMKTIYLPLPPHTEQDQIVRFLDWKLSKINKLINAKKKQIELLKEQKQAIINKAVTKGLDENVPMKDSGVEWLGEIPEHWEVTQIKRIATLFNGKEIENELEYSEDAINVYGSGGIFKYTDKFLYNGEAVLFGRKGTIGKPIIVNETFWTVDTMYYCISNSNCISKMLFYILAVFPWYLYTTKTALPSIVGNDIFRCYIALSNIAEQQDIVEYLDEKCSQIDILITKVNEEINLLHEYRTRLISDVVTGKVDVRDVVVPDFEAVEEVSEDTEEIDEAFETEEE